MARSTEGNGTSVYTIGHGSRPFAELLELLAASQIKCVVDVRAHPGSKRHPQYGRAELERSLPDGGVRYVWEGASLGGRRRPRTDSAHVALRHPSFRAYADHMETPEFAAGITRLLEHATAERSAIMCAERLPWQCHRFMISDYLVSQGVRVLHVVDPAPPREHHLRAEARLCDGKLIYDRHTQEGLDLTASE